MKSATLRSLLKIRQYQFDCEQWKLRQKQLDEMKMKEAMQHSALLLHEESKNAAKLTVLSQKMQAHRFLDEVRVLNELDSRRFQLARRETEQQMKVILEHRKKKDMMERLLDKAVKADRFEFDKRERLILDDLSKNRSTEKSEANL